MRLQPKLFFSFFLVSALLLLGMFLALSRLQKNTIEQRIDQAFQRAQSHFLDLRLQQSQTLRLATFIVSKDPKWMQNFSDSGFLQALSNVPNRKDQQNAELVMLANGNGEVIFSSFRPEESDYLLEVLQLKNQPKDFLIVGLKQGIFKIAVSQTVQKEKTFWIVAGFPVRSSDVEALLASTGLDFVFFSKSGPVVFVEAGRLALDTEALSAISKVSEAATHISIQGEPFQARLMSLSDSPNISVVAMQSLASYQNEGMRLWQAFTLGLVILLILSYILAQRLSRSISKPFDLLRDSVREVTTSLGIEYTQSLNLNEFQQIAENYRALALRLKQELKSRLQANEELEETKFLLLKSNSRLSRRLFQNDVMLSLWEEQEKSADTKEFLSRLLERLLPGVPFDYGCIIIRPMAEVGPETIIAKVEREKRSSEILDDGLEKKDRTYWLSELDPDLRNFLLDRSQESRSGKVLSVELTEGCLGPTDKKKPISVLTLSLRQGQEHLGSLHLLSEDTKPAVSESLQKFLINVSAQVAVLLQNRALSHASRVDPLTRLYNRGYMNDRLREELLRSSRTGLPFTFLLLDVDHFKKINDDHGHPAGDTVLVGLASLLKRTCRASDAICRYGGEEITIILVDTPISGAKIFAENLRKQISSEQFIHEEKSLSVTVSIGLAEFPTHGKKGEDLIQRADQALYLAKSGGRNAVRTAD